MNTEQLNALSYRVIGAAINVHRELGPGLEEIGRGVRRLVNPDPKWN